MKLLIVGCHSCLVGCNDMLTMLHGLQHERSSRLDSAQGFHHQINFAACQNIVRIFRIEFFGNTRLLETVEDSDNLYIAACPFGDQVFVFCQDGISTAADGAKTKNTDF